MSHYPQERGGSVSHGMPVLLHQAILFPQVLQRSWHNHTIETMPALWGVRPILDD
jgi:hypothetical protein